VASRASRAGGVAQSAQSISGSWCWPIPPPARMNCPAGISTRGARRRTRRGGWREYGRGRRVC